MKQDQEFQMEEYIRKRMLEIEDLKDRKLFKEIVGELLVKLHQYNTNAYQELEQKILRESKTKQSDYAIYISMTDLAHYDATDRFLFPMRAEDAKKTELSLDEIKKALKSGERKILYTIFVKGSVATAKKLAEEERHFKGVIRTNKRSYQGTFSIIKNEAYLDQIKELYEIFGANYQPWMTVCEAYLYKMFDVCLCTAEQIEEKEQVEEIQVDYEEYSNIIYTGQIPLWNLRKVTEKTSTYPDACFDKVNYEHRIFSHRLDEHSEYLIMNTDVEITNIRRVNGDLFITCPIPTPREWHLYQVTKKRGKEIYPYPVLSNQYKESFSGSITEMFKKSIKTKAELARLMESFGYENYVKFKDLEILSEMPNGLEDVNYNMDGFILDEIRIGGSQQVLLLLFTAVQPENYLNEDIMSFLVTQVQKIFPEYRCMGKFV